MNIVKKNIPTTNYDTSRKTIDTIFIHWVVGNLASADTRFKKEGEQASAHYGIEDEIIYQWVDEAHTAYHCGVYSWNQRSIGIEHSASPDRSASNSTYSTSAQLVAEICKRYNIPLDREHIKGHSEVKPTACPGTIDIDRIIREAKALLNPELAINDQTIIDLTPYGKHEVQAIRGFYAEALTWHKDLENTRKENEELKNRLQSLLNAPKSSSEANNLPSYQNIQLPPFLSKFLKWMLTKFR